MTDQFPCVFNLQWQNWSVDPYQNVRGYKFHMMTTISAAMLSELSLIVFIEQQLHSDWICYLKMEKLNE